MLVVQYNQIYLENCKQMEEQSALETNFKVTT